MNQIQEVFQPFLRFYKASAWCTQRSADDVSTLLEILQNLDAPRGSRPPMGWGVSTLLEILPTVGGAGGGGVKN